MLVSGQVAHSERRHCWFGALLNSDPYRSSLPMFSFQFCSWLTYGVVSTVAGTNSYVGNATREGNYVMRVAWPGAARNPDKFIECAKRVIHFNVPPNAGAPTARPDDPNNRTDLVKPHPPVRNMKLGQDQPEAYSKVHEIHLDSDVGHLH